MFNSARSGTFMKSYKKLRSKNSIRVSDVGGTYGVFIVGFDWH